MQRREIRSLEMPGTQVVLVGSPAVGTLAMQAAPDLALDLPTRVLLRRAPSAEVGSDADGNTVVFARLRGSDRRRTPLQAHRRAGHRPLGRRRPRRARSRRLGADDLRTAASWSVHARSAPGIFAAGDSDP
ncbi:MAG: DUF302 domain-containing protein [Actinomycetota bacterium]|jgi:hypothetical protein|nr:DUF302 domain-containing protein [Actinomycetota bacterium]